MPKLGYYTLGDWNAQCGECGRGFKFSQLRLRWDNQWVCNTGSCWEPRQPQDFVRGVKDDQSVPIARPRILPPSFSQVVQWTNGPSQFYFLNSPSPIVWTN